MNLGILLLGLVGGLVVGTGVHLQAGAARRRAEHLVATGIVVPGTITAVDAVGRYNAWRRVRVQVDGGEVIETIPFIEAQQLRLTVGAVTAVRVLPDDHHQGRIDRPLDAASGRRLGLWIGLFIAGLGLAAALVV